ncbi:phenylalanine--tRNA ligase subunit alpha [bacterium]|nr:phenylalanine--tRNA ligase subunit alpha [bacterium]MCI0565893.1 phenylalanine--tRNA ligase subunit alpha [bacterium]
MHPLTIITRHVVGIFTDMGYEVALGPEIETEYNNFDALNVPKDHPARDMQDTFWLKDRPGELLRTHVSAHQVPYMKEHTPPFKMVSPGRVFRYEATDATHEVQFHYIEGLLVGEKISLAHLKGTLEYFLKKLFGDDVIMRFRPAYFPFVEPGVEVDMRCFKCGGSGCSSCKNSGWIEILGAGLVHPNVLTNGGIDPKKWSGFAFGMGVDRLAMLKWGVDDVRLFYSGDLRLVNQF